ncbi:MAG: GTPase HflX, partial [Novosphingobium sp.]
MTPQDDPTGEVARGARAIVVCPQFRARSAQGTTGQDAEARLEEGRGLALAIGIEVV